MIGFYPGVEKRRGGPGRYRLEICPDAAKLLGDAATLIPFYSKACKT